MFGHLQEASTILIMSIPSIPFIPSGRLLKQADHILRSLKIVPILICGLINIDNLISWLNGLHPFCFLYIYMS